VGAARRPRSGLADILPVARKAGANQSPRPGRFSIPSRSRLKSRMLANSFVDVMLLLFEKEKGR
jgi:hypothetical protein